MTEYLECPRCDDWDIEVSDVDPDASLSEMCTHLRWDHNLKDPELRQAMIQVRLTTR